MTFVAGPTNVLQVQQISFFAQRRFLMTNDPDSGQTFVQFSGLLH